MTIQKINTSIKPSEEVDKINEIIDNIDEIVTDLADKADTSALASYAKLDATNYDGSTLNTTVGTQISNAIIGKADIDLSNSSVPHIVETYVNGTSGYRIWSDGYCEQWGEAVKPSQSANSTATATATLLVQLRDTNYNVSYCCLVDGGYTYELTQNACIKTTTTVGINFYSTVACNEVNICWKVCGYKN